jgi:hypothetical protein
MPLDLDAVAADLADATCYWQEEEVKIKYRPSAITTRTVESLNKSDDDDAEPFLEFVVSVLADWDVTRGKKKVQISTDTLRDIPLKFLRAIVSTIMEDSGRSEAGKV